MPFTDEDLKRLREEIESDVESSGMPMTRSYMNRLLARLEAADRLIERIDSDLLGEEEYQKCLKAYREACGK